jgi:hypothetical protein
LTFRGVLKFVVWVSGYQNGHKFWFWTLISLFMTQSHGNPLEFKKKIQI